MVSICFAKDKIKALALLARNAKTAQSVKYFIGYLGVAVFALRVQWATSKDKSP